jgi:hypothetical protein
MKEILFNTMPFLMARIYDKLRKIYSDYIATSG